jgi:hypothetical protein
VPGRLRRGRQARLPSPSAPRSLTVTSPDFPADGALPARFSCNGDKARPALRFAGAKPDDVIAAVRASAGAIGLLVGRYARR